MAWLPSVLSLLLLLAPPAPGDASALELWRRGEEPEAIAQLTREAAQGRDEAALALGNALLSQRHAEQALAPLTRVVAKGALAPGYAQVLLARAILESETASRYDEAERLLVEWAAAPSASPVVHERAAFLLVKLRSARQSWPPAAQAARAYLQEWTRGRRPDEVRWLLAEALRQAGRREEALRAYESVWYDATQSPWSKQAGARMRELVAAGGGTPRPLRAQERYQQVRELQRVGLHEEALAELGTYQRQAGAHVDAALLLRAASLYALRRNAECVSAARKLRSRFPSSPHLPAAALQAIAAMRRGGDEPGIRGWVHYLEESHRGNPKTDEALYDLGVFLQSVKKDEEARQVLERVAKDRTENASRDDALWKLAWLERKAGRDAAAVAWLKRLLEELPQSSYRKAALYWSARLAPPADRTFAVAQLSTLLEEFPHDYYGHEGARLLASLGVASPRLGNGKAFPAFDRLEDPRARPGQKAYALAVELRRLGLDELASEELERVPGAESEPALVFPLAQLKAQAGETVEALRLVERAFHEYRQAGSRDPSLVPREFWSVCYPYRYRAWVERAARESGLEKAGVPDEVLAALIWTESRFQPTAISPVGAIGLMQLMPEVAARQGERVSREQLFDPEVNIRTGARYFASLVRAFAGQAAPAICSYNAGLDAVKGWFAGRGSMPLDELLESIPYVETRLYVKQILGDARNYGWIYPASRRNRSGISSKDDDLLTK